MPSSTFRDRGVDPVYHAADYEAEICGWCGREIAWDAYGPNRHELCERRLDALVCCGIEWRDADECGTCGRELGA